MKRRNEEGKKLLKQKNGKQSKKNHQQTVETVES